MQIKESLSVLVLGLMLSGSGFAGTLQCTGKVEEVGMHANDKIMLRLSSMNVPVFICNTKEKWQPAGSSYFTSPETCNAMLSMLLTAKATGSDMGSVWMDGDHAEESCGSFGDWKSVNIRYFMF